MIGDDKVHLIFVTPNAPAREANFQQKFQPRARAELKKQSIENQSRLKRKVSGKVSATRARGKRFNFQRRPSGRN
jgi:hypothetical protein